MFDNFGLFGKIVIEFRVLFHKIIIIVKFVLVILLMSYANIID